LSSATQGWRLTAAAHQSADDVSSRSAYPCWRFPYRIATRSVQSKLMSRLKLLYRHSAGSTVSLQSLSKLGSDSRSLRIPHTTGVSPLLMAGWYDLSSTRRPRLDGEGSFAHIAKDNMLNDSWASQPAISSGETPVVCGNLHRSRPCDGQNLSPRSHLSRHAHTELMDSQA
jgi:hypothetical protein